MEKELIKIMDKHDLNSRDNILKFIDENPEKLSLDSLARISELVNTKRIETAAFYTDSNTLKTIENYLPKINKNVIRVLEPSVGVGNFVDVIIRKYSNANQLIIDVNDIDETSLLIMKYLNKYRDLPRNVKINYFNEDYLTLSSKYQYDLVIGNPPFLKLSKNKGLNEYSLLFDDNITKNISGFFLQKSLNIADYIVLIQPKYFLHNNDFSLTRNRVKKHKIDYIIDFGEKGFKGVLIETIALFIDVNGKIDNTTAYSLTKDLINVQKQDILTSDEFPSWIIYRNDFFNELVSKLKFNIFKVFRDRQITNKILKEKGDIRVLKSRNLSRDGSKILDIENYDSYIDKNDLKGLSVEKYIERDDVYLCPNMTYYPRMFKKPKNTVVNGSVAILENNSNYSIDNNDLKFFSSSTFEEFYRVARNYSTRSLNIDKNSVVFFGIKR